MKFTITILSTPTARDLTFNVNAPGLADARIRVLKSIIKQKKHYVVVSVKRATATNV